MSLSPTGGRKVRYRHNQAPVGFTPPELPAEKPPTRPADHDSFDDTMTATGTDSFLLPSAAKATRGNPPAKHKVVRVARQDPATGAVTWEEAEVRYGKPKVKPFALNCTFGLPRVLTNPAPSHPSSPSPFQRHASSKGPSRASSPRLPPISVTPEPSSFLRQEKCGTAHLHTTSSPMPSHPHPQGPGSAISLTLDVNHSHWTPAQPARVGATPKTRSRGGSRNSSKRPFVSITERIAEARRINDGSFEAFVRPRSGWPASERARQNVPPFASVARARRRHATGDSSSDSDNEVDPHDLQERLQKLNDRRKRLLRELRRCGGAHAERAMKLEAATKGVPSRASVALAESVAAKEPAAPATTVETSLSMVDYEIAWTTEQLRRMHEDARQQEQQQEQRATHQHQHQHLQHQQSPGGPARGTTPKPF